MAVPSLVYARALFEVAEKSGVAQICAQDLHSFWENCSSSAQLRAVLCGAGISTTSRKQIMGDICAALSLNSLTARFLMLLAERGRVDLVPELLHEFERLLDRASGVSSGELRSAVELSADDINGLCGALAKKIGGKVRLKQKLDASLLGGFVATVAGKTYDASLKTQLERFKNELI